MSCKAVVLALTADGFGNRRAHCRLVGWFAAHRLVVSALIPSIVDRAWAIYGFRILGLMNQPRTGSSP